MLDAMQIVTLSIYYPRFYYCIAASLFVNDPPFKWENEKYKKAHLECSSNTVREIIRQT